MAQQTGVLAIADTDPCLPEEKLLELEQKVRLLDPAARALVEELLRVPKAQQEILQERLTSGSEERTWSTIREIASSGGQARYLGAVPSVQATTAKELPGSQDWFYLLKCRECKPAVWGITKIGRGSTPVEHAHELGWREPPNGKKKWARSLCPPCATAAGWAEPAP